MPDWGKVQFKEYPSKPWEEILSEASPDGRDLASSLVRFETSQRLTATQVSSDSYDRFDLYSLTFWAGQALKHAYFEA